MNHRSSLSGGDFIFCTYHQNLGHLTKNCYALKEAIQNLIDNGTIEVNSLHNNEDHTTFKSPFMSHEKGESCKNKQALSSNDKFNYAHNCDNTTQLT